MAVYGNADIGGMTARAQGKWRGVGVAVLLQVWDFQSVTWALSVLGVCPLLGVSAQGGYCIQLHTATSHINIALVYQWVACPADYSQIGHFSWEKLCNSLNQSVGEKKKSSHCTRQRPGIWNATNDNCPETQMHIYRVSVCKTLIVTFLHCTYIQSCHRAILNFPEMAIAAVRSLALRACATFWLFLLTATTTMVVSCMVPD